MPVGTSRGLRLAARRGALAALIVTAIAVTGCASQSASALPIKIASAYVMQANGVKTVDAYFVLANPGPADQLVAVHSSAGGKVLMLDPDAQGVLGSSGVATVRLLNEINFPARSTTKLDPTGAHLEIVDSGPLRQGTDITLTLVFAHAGKIKVLAQVSNPQTGNSGYFGP
ncbi:MAG TPA: copper chaperone PCu(A)C [Streptosporangiaceae bacterium]|jgi:copper(I)-binding protein|nr:copper chaperone PCu(A)C [Streptosporangiaceae bacterium]